MLMPPNLRRVLAMESPKRSLPRDIQHVVILMQENRSFDHYSGTLSGVRGFDDPAALKLLDGQSVFHQPDNEDPNGGMLLFHLDTGSSSAQKIPSTSHAWAVQHEARNGGRMDRWLPAHRKADGVKAPYTMSYYKREDIPFQFALAEAFTILDDYHCSVMGPTFPNRMFLMTGTIDPDALGGGPIISNAVPNGGYTWTTYPERLERAGVSWKVYQQEDNYHCNMLQNFKAFQQAAKGSSLHSRGVLYGPEGQFKYDAMHDKLPTVSWIIPTSFQSEHPDCMPAEGAAFVASKIDAIAANPDVTMWHPRSLRLAVLANLSTDFRSAVASGFPASSFRRGQSGVGYAAPFDHTSVLQFLETVGSRLATRQAATGTCRTGCW
jgi:phospholipase C